MSTDRPKYVDPNTIPDFYRKNPDYQGEDVIESLTPDTPDPVTPLTAEEDLMSALSAANPRSRQHREETMGPDGMGYSMWTCVPLRDVVPFRNRLLDAARQSDGAEADPLLASPDLPPLPWSSAADRQPWPNEASQHHRIVDANGYPIFGRNWREACAAIQYLVRSANRAALQAAPVSVDRERLTHIRGIASGEGGDEASRSDPQNALATIVIVCDEALSHAV